ncbi:unnamed protein product [Rhizophagus irregularis]|nr:unnamed protein product [Rhizophagus irregularis]
MPGPFYASGDQISKSSLEQYQHTKRNKGTMQKLQSYSELVDALKNDREFHEFHKSTDEWLIDQENKEYFKKTYGITNIHPLFVDHYGMTVLFLDDRGILFTWCEMTKDMDILKINKMEGLATIQKRCVPLWRTPVSWYLEWNLNVA